MVIHPRFRGKKLAVTKECMVHNEMAPRFYPWQHRFESRGYIALWPDRSPRPWTCKIQWAGLTEQSWTNASANETFCEQSPVEIVRNFPEILWEPKSPERILRLGSQNVITSSIVTREVNIWVLEPGDEKEKKSDDEGYDDVLLVCGSSFIIEYEGSWSNKISVTACCCCCYRKRTI